MLEIWDIEQALRRAKLPRSSTLPSYNLNLPELTFHDQLAARFLYVLLNPENFTPYLDELNSKLAQKIPHLGADAIAPLSSFYVNLSKRNTTFPIPTPKPIQCSEQLINTFEEILLENENIHGVNVGRTIKDIPEFYWHIPDKIAGEILEENLLWNDVPNNAIAYFHGKYSHRIQFYILTRAMDDKIINLNECNNFYKYPIFKNLIVPAVLAPWLAPVIDRPERAYWHIVLDNEAKSTNDYFMKCTDAMSGPVMLMEYLMSNKSFAGRPHLAHCLYHSSRSELVKIGQAIGKNTEDMFLIFCRIYNDGTANADVGPKLKQILNESINHIPVENIYWLTSNLGTRVPAGIAFRHAQNPLIILESPHSVYRNEYTKPFFVQFDAKRYGAALRTLANSPNKNTYLLAKILLKSKDTIKLDVNEKSASLQLTAYQLAAAKSGQEAKEFCELLIQYGAHANVAYNPEVKQTSNDFTL